MGALIGKRALNQIITVFPHVESCLPKVSHYRLATKIGQINKENVWLRFFHGTNECNEMVKRWGRSRGVISLVTFHVIGINIYSKMVFEDVRLHSL